MTKGIGRLGKTADGNTTCDYDAEEIKRLIGKVEQKGHTLVPLNLHWKNGFVKCEIALAKGKAEHDKRNTIKDRDWEREKGRLMRHKVSSSPKE